MSRIIAVIGANYGDEGKGYMADYFCAQAISRKQTVINILSNGGGQRGHTVETAAGGRFVFHHMGAGTIAGADSYFAPDYIVNPLILLRDYQEYMDLSARFPAIYPDRFELFMSPDCRFSTPFDMMANQIFENHRGKARHGSVGVGIWETVRRYEKGQGLSVSDFRDLSCKEKIVFLKHVKKYFEDRIFHKLHCSPKDIPGWENVWDAEEIIEHFLEDFQKMLFLAPMVAMEELKAYDTIVIENAQGLLLSQHRYDGSNHTTPSDTGAREIRNLLGQGLLSCLDGPLTLCYVTRSYLTKHGAGHFPGECASTDIAPDLKDLTNLPHPFQGTLRYGKLDERTVIKQILEDEKDLGSIPHELWISLTHLNESLPDLSMFAKTCSNLYLSDGRYRENCRKAISPT